MQGRNSGRWLIASSIAAIAVPAIALGGSLGHPPDSEPVSANCPSAAESEAHFKATGEDFKPDGRCVEPEVLSADPGPAEPPEDQGVPTASLTLAELQQAYDSENDPYLLVDKSEDGDVVLRHLAVANAHALDPPPGFGVKPFEQSDVETHADFRAYLTDVEEAELRSEEEE